MYWKDGFCGFTHPYYCNDSGDSNTKTCNDANGGNKTVS